MTWNVKSIEQDREGKQASTYERTATHRTNKETKECKE